MTTQIQFEALDILREIIEFVFTDLSPKWWTQFIVPSIHRRNQDRAWNFGPDYLPMIDLTDAVFVLINNWEHLSVCYRLSDRYKEVLFHLKSARNAFAHASSAHDSGWDDYDEMALRRLRALHREIIGQVAA